MNRLRFLGVSVLGSVLLLTPQTANAGWMRTYGGSQGDGVDDLKPTLDGGYVLLGSTCSFSSDTSTSDIWLLKLNSEGDTLWTRTYGGPLSDGGPSIEQTSDSGYIIAGVKDAVPFETSDIWLLKTDSLGDTLWTRTYGGDSIDKGKYVHQTSDGGYIIIGTTESFGTGGKDIWVLKTNASGDTLWTRTYGGEEDDWCISAQHLSGDQGYIILGNFDSSFLGYCLMRIDEDGDSLWMRPYPAWRASYIERTGFGCYILTGCIHSDDEDNLFDVWLSLSDPWGDTVWTHNYGGKGVEEGNCVKPTSDGGYIITGFTTKEMPFGKTDVLLLKTDPGGSDTLWTRTYGGDSTDWGIRVLQTPDKGYLIAAETECFGAGGFDIWLIKTDSLGYVDVKEESYTQVNGNWEVETSIGPQIVLRYADYPQGFRASVFDASGRKVDEINAAGSFGTITWGKWHRPGVYFIRVESGYHRALQKVILVH